MASSSHSPTLRIRLWRGEKEIFLSRRRRGKETDAARDVDDGQDEDNVRETRRRRGK